MSPAAAAANKRAAGSKPGRRPTRVARDPHVKKLTDPLAIRAVAHPVRLALLEALMREGPLTATEAAELVGESPANCSFHFRTLAKYGFVEEVPGSTGRSRPWRRVAMGESIDLREQGEGEGGVAAHALAELSIERVYERLHTYLATGHTEPPEWQVGFTNSSLLYLTPDELEDLGEQVRAIVDAKYRERTADVSKRPPGSRAVQYAAFGFPLPPTSSGQ
jgi:DNA-binding transcriptional ArsR family regulator